MIKPELVKRYKCFGGSIHYYTHQSAKCNGPMNFGVFLPPMDDGEKAPVLYWLSGLTCTEENFITKANAFQWASEKGLAIVIPDTSPRKTGIEGEDKDWDLGSGASFYVDATEKKWSKHYQMYSYILDELPSVVNSSLPLDPERKSIFGHSMGGHGALVLALRNPARFRSVSAFSPIVNPVNCPWGQKAFRDYLGSDQSKWKEYDATELMMKGSGENRLPIFIDQGRDDEFLKEQLLTRNLEEASQSSKHPMHLRYRVGYDHSYFFVSSFMKDHIHYHWANLQV